MNIISNNCIAGQYYKHILKTPFNHPIIWGIIPLSYYKILIENFADINFNKINIFFTEGEVNKDENDIIPDIYYSKVPTLIIDNKVKMYFIHHHYSNVEGFKIINGLKQGKDVLDFIKEKYFERLKRFNKDDKTIFIYTTNAQGYDCNIKTLLNIKTKHKIIILTNEKIVSNNPNIIIGRATNDTIEMAKIVNNILINYENTCNRK